MEHHHPLHDDDSSYPDGRLANSFLEADSTTADGPFAIYNVYLIIYCNIDLMFLIAFVSSLGRAFSITQNVIVLIYFQNK